MAKFVKTTPEREVYHRIIDLERQRAALKLILEAFKAEHRNLDEKKRDMEKKIETKKEEIEALRKKMAKCLS
jgi:chromosome segregation ATPase